MSGIQYSPYYSIPTADHDASVPLTYPPSTPPVRPGPSPLNGPYNPQLPHLPTSSASGSFPYASESPKSWKPLELEHDFTANSKRPVDDPNRWSFSSVSRPPGLQRFTRAWWRYNWNLQVSRRRMPRLLYGITGLLLLVVWLAIATVFAMSLQAAEFANKKQSGNATQSARAANASVVFLVSGQLNTFDPTRRNLNVDWTAIMAKGPIKPGQSIDDFFANIDQIPVDQAVDFPIAIYRDTVSRFDANATADTSPFRLRAPNVKPIGFLGISSYDQVNTDIGLAQQATDITTQPEFGYPFDVFTGNLTLVAANNDTITQTGRLGSDVRVISGAILTDSILNFKVRTSTYTSCFDDSDPGCELTITFSVTRTGLVKFCVIAVFLVNWIITIAIFLITGEALVLNRSNILEGTDILAICFTAMFALPTVRSLLPGVPSSYGCLLDIVGILPNVIIVALCTTFFTNSRLRLRARRAAEAAAQAAAEAKAA